MLLDQSMLPKVKSSVSDFTSTQNIVEILDEWLQLKFGNKHLLI